MGIPRPKSLEERNADVRLVVAIGILQKKDFRSVGANDPAIDDADAFMNSAKR